MQNTLEIAQDKRKMYLVYMLWGFFIFSCITQYFILDFSKFWFISPLVFLCIAACAHLFAHQALKRKVKIDIKNQTIIVEEYTLFNNQKFKQFSTSEFNAVRSYILASRGGNTNLVELVRASDNYGLLLTNLPPSSGKQFWSLKSAHLENSNAEALRKNIVAFMQLKDLGFLGVIHKGFGFIR